VPTVTIWRSFIQRFSSPFRARRDRLITTTFPNLTDLAVCDLGGSLHYWERWSPSVLPRNLTLLNVGVDGQSASHTGSLDELEIELYDGRTIPYPDKHFDVLICNSVIEHVTPADRTRLATEIRRVAKYHFVQTPAFEFPVEPHFVLPFVHWLPRKLGVHLVPIGLWAIMNRPSREHMRNYFDEVRLLTKRQLRSYFPDSVIAVERFLLLPKSYTAHGPKMVDPDPSSTTTSVAGTWPRG
jgi:hypothetical protein